MMSSPCLVTMLLTLCVSAAPTCRFAHNYNAAELYNDVVKRTQFIDEVLLWESKFIKQMGTEPQSGLTSDGQPLDIETGEPLGLPREFTASSKESVHLAILAKALDGDRQAQIIYTVDEALELAEKKIDSYERFATKYPGFGGFLPWIKVSGTDISPTSDWNNRVPSLDNGQLFWAAYGLAHVLETKYSHLGLAERYNRFWRTMADNAITMFYEEDGKIRTVAALTNQSLPVAENQYHRDQTDCSVFENPCYLDDPYEGELFATMMYLFSPWNDPNERDRIFARKLSKLQATDFTINESGQKITVQKGWWFSAHEQWKYFFLPYLQNDLNKRVFLNGERARTWDARQSNLPGMFASVTGSLHDRKEDFKYFSGCGIQEISFAKVTCRFLITPYSTMSLFLADYPTATVWYHNMISGPAGQTMFGSVESLEIDGSAVSPLVTWDSKITTVVGMLGGISDLVSRKMEQENVLAQFLELVAHHWGGVFTELKGEDLPYALPSAQITVGRKDFQNCQNVVNQKFISK